MKVSLFGAEAEKLRPIVSQENSLTIVDDGPDVVICYGGDGTLLAAEQKWPSVPKVPIRNSRRGIRCIAGPPEAVIRKFVNGELIKQAHLKLRCRIDHNRADRAEHSLLAINEFSVHMARGNASVRFRVWFDDIPYGNETDHEIIGDGFVVSTPFGSTAYFNQITRGVFWQGIGVAFKYTIDHTNHLIVPEDTVVRTEITRGPAVLAYDNSAEYVDLREGDSLVIQKHDQPALVYSDS